MSIFKDTIDIYHLDWYSSPWKPYFNKLTSRLIGYSAGTPSAIKAWCAEEELEGKEFKLTVTGDDSTDHLSSVQMEGALTVETDEFLVNDGLAHDDKTVKWWYGPGVAIQFPDNTHATTSFTHAETTYLHVIAASDIGERVYDGGLHCWMKLPHLPRGHSSTPTAAETDVYSKNIPMEYLGRGDFLMVFNSFGHLPIATTGNKGLTVQFQNSPRLNAQSSEINSGFVDTLLPAISDIDITNINTDVNSSYMATALITSGDTDTREASQSMRFYWYTHDGGGAEAVYHGGQFIRVSLYPVKSN